MYMYMYLLYTHTSLTVIYLATRIYFVENKSISFQNVSNRTQNNLAISIYGSLLKSHKRNFVHDFQF
jgi:hypothetical protein